MPATLQPPLTTTASDGAAAQLAGLLDSAMDAIITVDGSQHIVQYNRAAETTFGWPVADVLGKSLEVLLPERFRKGHAAHMRDFADTGVTSRRMGGSAVVHGLHRDGTEFPLEASISQLHTPLGKLYTVILRDVSERVRAQKELAAYAAAAAAIREQEKTRVARELHDELAQTLTAIKMDTTWLLERIGTSDQEAARKISGVLQMIADSVGATRRIAADLRPLVLDDLGLVAAIEWLAQNFSKRHGVRCVLDVDESLDLPEPWASGVFRIVQEALNNVGKHAGAARVDLLLRRDGDGLELRVEDDGCGFVPSAVHRPGALGLAGLRERVQLLHGTVAFDSKPGRGARVIARIPLQAATAAT